MCGGPSLGISRHRRRDGHEATSTTSRAAVDRDPAVTALPCHHVGVVKVGGLVNRLRERWRGKDEPSATRRVLPIFPAGHGRRLGAGLGRSPGIARRSGGVRATATGGVDAPDSSLQMLSLSWTGARQCGCSTTNADAAYERFFSGWARQ